MVCDVSCHSAALYPSDGPLAHDWRVIPGTWMAYSPQLVAHYSETPLMIRAGTPLWWAHWIIGFVGPFVMLLCAVYVGHRAWRWTSVGGGELRRWPGTGLDGD